MLPIQLLNCQQPHQHHGVMHKSGKCSLEQTWWGVYRGVDCSLLSCLHALRCIFCSTLTLVIFSPNPHWLKWHCSRQFVLFLAACSGATKDDTVQPRLTKRQTNFTASFKSREVPFKETINLMVGWDTVHMLTCAVWMLDAVAAQHHTTSVSTSDDSYCSLNSLSGLF